MVKQKVTKAAPKERKVSLPRKPAVREVFTSKNKLLMGIGILVLIIGYIALDLGSITLAPILLVGAYCVIIPIAIVANSKGKKKLRKAAAKEKS